MLGHGVSYYANSKVLSLFRCLELDDYRLLASARQVPGCRVGHLSGGGGGGGRVSGHRGKENGDDSVS